MPRYIDADEALRMMRNSKQDCPFVDGKKSVWDVAHDCAISCVDAVPTADVVEVIRCKDCEHCEHIKDEFCKDWYQCKRRGNFAQKKPYDFCSYGKRKVQEVNNDVR